MTSFAECAADVNAECAAVAIETLRSVDASSDRTRLAEAEMRVLSGDAETAEALVARVLRPSESKGPTVTARVGASRRPLTPILTLGLSRGDGTTIGDLDPDVLAKLAPAERGDVLLVAGRYRRSFAATGSGPSRGGPRRRESSTVRPHRAAKKAHRRPTTGRCRREALRRSDRPKGRIRAALRLRPERQATARRTRRPSLRARVRTVTPALAAQKLTLAIDAADRCGS